MSGKATENITTPYGPVKVAVTSNRSMKLTFDKLVVLAGVEYYGSMSLMDYGTGEWQPDQEVAILKNRLRGLRINPYHPMVAGPDQEHGRKYSETVIRKTKRDEKDDAQRKIHAALLAAGITWARKNPKCFSNANANNKQAEIERLEGILGVFGIEKWLTTLAGVALDNTHFAIDEKVMARIEEIELSGKELFVAKTDKELGILPPMPEKTLAEGEKKKRKKPLIDPKLFVKIKTAEPDFIKEVAAPNEEYPIGEEPYGSGNYSWRSKTSS